MNVSLQISSASIYALAFSLLGTYVTFVVFYRLFLSPLRSVPGPWYAAISDFWLTTHILRLRRCRAINDLLQKYGPIVRVAPHKVIFLDAPTMRVVYGVGSKLSKSKFYKCLTTNGNDHAMTTLEHGPHLVRKRGYAPHYNPANLALFQPEIHKCANELANILSTAASGSLMSIDSLLLFRHFLIDINCVQLFGYEAGSLKSWSQNVLYGGPPDELSRAISDYPKRGLLRGALPGWLWDLIQHIPVHRWQLFCDSDAVLGRFALARLRESRASLHDMKEHADQDSRKPLIARLLRHKYSEQEVMPDKDIVSECLGHLIAGTDTTSTTLSYLLWELSRRRDIMLRLQAEIDECMPDPHCIPDIRDLQKLPYLAAIIKEGLRVYSSAPSPLERVVPENPNSEFSLLGHAMPPGTIVASQAFSSHRHQNVFFCPDLFLPDRWLLEDLSAAALSPIYTAIKRRDSITVDPQPPATALPKIGPSFSQTLSDVEKGSATTASTVASTLCASTSQAEMAAHMFPFGHGPRVCAGQNFAQIMLRVVLATIARNFDIVAPPETNEKSMEMRDAFVTFPAALECKLIFVPRSR